MTSIQTFGTVLRTRHAAAIVALTAATPALAANFSVANVSPDILLLGSGVLLAAALAMRLLKRRETSTPRATAPDLPDLRWWKNAHA